MHKNVHTAPINRRSSHKSWLGGASAQLYREKLWPARWVYSHQAHPQYSQELTLPPRVAESRKCVPYFLIRFSVICWRVGRRPSSLMLRKNSGASGSGEPRKFLLSTARLFTFQRPNSLQNKAVLIEKCVIQTNALHLQTTLLCWVAGGDSLGITTGLDSDALSCAMDRTSNEGYLLEVETVLHNKIIVGKEINKN